MNDLPPLIPDPYILHRDPLFRLATLTGLASLSFTATITITAALGGALT